MNDSDIIKCFNRLIEKSDDGTDDVFILLYIFHISPHLSIYHDTMIRRIKEKLNRNIELLNLNELRKSFFESLPKSINLYPREHQIMDEIIEEYS